MHLATTTAFTTLCPALPLPPTSFTTHTRTHKHIFLPSPPLCPPEQAASAGASGRSAASARRGHQASPARTGWGRHEVPRQHGWGGRRCTPCRGTWSLPPAARKVMGGTRGTVHMFSTRGAQSGRPAGTSSGGHDMTRTLQATVGPVQRIPTSRQPGAVNRPPRLDPADCRTSIGHGVDRTRSHSAMPMNLRGHRSLARRPDWLLSITNAVACSTRPTSPRPPCNRRTSPTVASSNRWKSSSLSTLASGAYRLVPPAPLQCKCEEECEEKW